MQLLHTVTIWGKLGPLKAALSPTSGTPPAPRNPSRSLAKPVHEKVKIGSTEIQPRAAQTLQPAPHVVKSMKRAESGWHYCILLHYYLQ